MVIINGSYINILCSKVIIVFLERIVDGTLFKGMDGGIFGLVS